MASNIYTIIMAGGIGSRFWPQSRIAKPKQFIDILGTGQSLMQMTWARAMRFSAQDQILILTNELYKDLVAEHLPDMRPENILTEPSRNNTAPCIAYAAFKLYQQDPEAVMVILPSDHLILKEAVYFQKIQTAIDYVEQQEALLTLGIQPTRPDTGYGYIQYDNKHAATEVLPVISFKEKPDQETAAAYLDSGQFLWNAGIFIWKAKTVIEAFKQLTPELYQLFAAGNKHYNTSTETTFIRQEYAKSPNISIDYAIMEKASNVFTVPADIGWSDLGTWASLWEVKEKDAGQNVVTRTQEVILSNTENCIVAGSEDKLTVIDGLHDFIIVDQKDVLLIYPKGKEQAIKQVIKGLEDRDANRYL